MSRNVIQVPLDMGNGGIANMHITELLTPADRDCLTKLAADTSVAYDVGAFTGSSGEAILSGMKLDGVCYSVDTFRGVGGDHDYPSKIPRPLIMSIWATRLARFGTRARLYVGESVEFARMQPAESADLIFIDAGHSYLSAKADIDAWLRVLKPSGVIAGHDYDKRLADVPEQVIRDNQYYEASGVDFGGGGELVHCGVIAAVWESFEQFYVEDDPDSTIWWAHKP